MIRFILFSVCFCFIIGVASAQDNLTGRIYEYNSRNAVPGIAVRNLKTNYTSVSDQTGAFSIPAKAGDLIVFTGFAYQSDTLFVQDLKYTDIRLLLKGHTLDEVKVTGQEVRLGNMKAAPTLSPINSQALQYSTDAQGNYKGGLTANIFDSHSAANKRRHETEVDKDENIKAKIAGVFSPAGLKDYVPLQGQELQNFITLYTPDVPTFTAPEFNLTLYINTCYGEFLKIPLEKRQSKQFTELSNSN